MRAIVFYPLAAVAAAAAILISMGYALVEEEPGPQAGVAQNGSVLFGPEALFHIAPGQDHLMNLVRTGIAGKPAGVQIATLKTSREPSPALQGAQLLLDPAVAAQFVGKAIRVDVTVRPLPYTTAEKLAVSAQAPGPVEWISLPLPAERAALSFRLPAIEGAAPEAIGFWPIPGSDDYDYGVEIVDVRLSVAGAEGGGGVAIGTDGGP